MPRFNFIFAVEDINLELYVLYGVVKTTLTVGVVPGEMKGDSRGKQGMARGSWLFFGKMNKIKRSGNDKTVTHKTLRGK